MVKRKFLKYKFGAFFIGIFFLCSFSREAMSQKKDFAMYGDTTAFTPNTNDGWNILFAYMNQDTKDSIEFELILKQSFSRIRGSKEQLVGTITNKAFLPLNEQKAGYALLPGNTWYLLIKKNGQCYLAQVKGLGIMSSNLPGNPDVIPLKVKYKK